jgi:prepilin-type processing-associated H-X9-DG protein
MKKHILAAYLMTACLASPVKAAGGPERAPLPPDLAAVPADALGFVHIRVAEVWKCDALKEMRETILKAGEKALQGFDQRFLPAPSSIERLTVVILPPRDPLLINDQGVLAILGFNRAFDADEVVKASMQNATEKKTTNGSYWIDQKSGTAVSFVKDRAIVFGTIASVHWFIDKRGAGPGALTDLLHAANSGRHITAGLNLSLATTQIPKDLPPAFRPLLAAKTALIHFDVKENAALDLSLNFDDERSAAAGLSAALDLAKFGREFVKKGREEMLSTVLGDGKVAPLTKLPESAMALLALGSLERVDAFLAEPPLKQEGRVVKATATIPNLNSGALAPIAVGLLLPAVQKVREAASRAQSMNNLKQIGLAMHSYHDAVGTFPSMAICDKQGKPLLSWRVAILPYIEEQNLYERFKLDEPWDSEHNKKLIPLMPKTYFNPSAPTPATEGKTHYRLVYGKEMIFDVDKALSFAGITDGTSNTILAFEAEEPVEWTRPKEFAYDANKPLPKFGAFSRGGFNVLFADGSVRVIPSSTSEKTMRLLLQPADGEVVELP